MTPEHDRSRLIESWLDESYHAERGAQPFLDRLLDDLPTVPQRRRRWWSRMRRMEPPRPRTVDTTEYQPSPIPARNGPTPAVIGRTRTALSPAKTITVGALVVAIGGAVLLAQPFQQHSSVPGAATDRAGLEPAFVSGTLKGKEESNHAGEFYAGDFYALDDDSVLFTRERWDEAGRLMMDDPRITGDWNGTVAINRYRSPGSAGRAETYSGTITVENDAGTWVGTLLGCSGCGQREMRHVGLVGTGAYEGLAALLYYGSGDGLYGVIVIGDLAPEDPEGLGSE